MKTRLLAMGTVVVLAAALASCGGGGGGGGGGGPIPTVGPTATPTPATSTTITLNGSQQTAPIPASAGFSGTITVPSGSGTLVITDSATNPSAVQLLSKTGAHPQATATPNPYGCIGTTPFAKTGAHAMSNPPHPIGNGDNFQYNGTIANTFTQSAPCPQPTATANATVNETVTAIATSAPGIGSVTDLQSTENDFFPLQTQLTVTDSLVNNTSNAYVMYEQKVSNYAGTLDRKWTTPQKLDQLPEAVGPWSNADPSGTMTETLNDGTSVSRTIAADGSYTETENFPNVTTTQRNGVFFFTATAQTNVTLNGVPGFTLNVPSSVTTKTGSLSLAMLQNASWTTIAGPVSIVNGSVTFPASSGSFSIPQGSTAYFAVFYTATTQSGGGQASITMNGKATSSTLNGAGTYNVAGTSFSYAAPAGGTIALTIGSTGTHRTFPAWFTVPASYITDTFVDNGQVAFDASCTPLMNAAIVTLAGGKGEQIVETYNDLDPVLGYTETRTTTSYVVNGFGAVCVKLDDALHSYYDYQNDTTKIDYQSQNGLPNSVNHTVEFLGMNGPTAPYPSLRTQSLSNAQPVSPMIVAQHIAQLQLQRDALRVQKIRALLKGSVR